MRQLAIGALALFLTFPAAAQHLHGEADLTETGQAQFAAIAEIVEQLRADPDTNWDVVNIDALRTHLVDMDLVTTQAKVQSYDIDNGAQFLVTGDGATIGAIQRMTQAHAGMLSADTGWTMQVGSASDGAEVRVLATNSRDAAEIRALGFFGVMTIGAHHQLHHQMMATGQAPH